MDEEEDHLMENGSANGSANVQHVTSVDDQEMAKDPPEVEQK